MKLNNHFLVLFCSLLFFCAQGRIKILHLAFHKGCIKDFQEVARHYDFDLTSQYILESKETRYSFDPHPADWRTSRLLREHPLPDWNTVYNIDHERAERIWLAHKEYFEQFDAIIVSDTAALSRIFLQNGWQKPLIIWICNRFDYFDPPTRNAFPDGEYYQLLSQAHCMPNVRVFGYVAYEQHYARSRRVIIDKRVIKPCGACEPITSGFKSSIPAYIKKENTLFIPPRMEKFQADHLIRVCNMLGIQAYCGVYNGPNDLKDFKGILHFPYQWSNLALFENIQLGLPHFVPSIRFLKQLAVSNDRMFYKFFALDNLELCEWWCPENKDIIIYFDSWEDLKNKMQTINFPMLRDRIRQFAQKHKGKTFAQWKQVFEELGFSIR